MTKLSDDEIKRYDRHLKLTDFGLEKQIKLKEAKLLLVGAGGLGCPIALYLAASGVGSITIIDDDKIEVSNLQRQVAFAESEIGQLKAKILANKMRELNSSIEVIDIAQRMNVNNVEQLIAGCNLVIDGTDNFASRFLIADSCYKKKISYLHAAVYQYQGQLSLFVPGKTACFRCLYKQPPSASALPACGEAGILGVVTGTIGLMAATEAVKYLAGLSDSLAGKVLIYDTLRQDLKRIGIECDANCPSCSENVDVAKLQETYKSACMSEKEQVSCTERMELNEHIITIAQAAKLVKNIDATKGPVLLDVREEREFELGHLNRAKHWPLSMLRTMPIENRAKELRIRLGQQNTEHSIESQNSLDHNNGNNDKEQIIICYCQRGARSLKAVSLLQEAGVSNIVSLDGGLEAWGSIHSERSDI